MQPLYFLPLIPKLDPNESKTATKTTTKKIKPVSETLSSAFEKVAVSSLKSVQSSIAKIPHYYSNNDLSIEFSQEDATSYQVLLEKWSLPSSITLLDLLGLELYDLILSLNRINNKSKIRIEISSDFLKTLFIFKRVCITTAFCHHTFKEMLLFSPDKILPDWITGLEKFKNAYKEKLVELKTKFSSVDSPKHKEVLDALVRTLSLFIAYLEHPNAITVLQTCELRDHFGIETLMLQKNGETGIRHLKKLLNFIDDHLDLFPQGLQQFSFSEIISELDNCGELKRLDVLINLCHHKIKPMHQLLSRFKTMLYLLDNSQARQEEVSKMITEFSMVVTKDRNFRDHITIKYHLLLMLINFYNDIVFSLEINFKKLFPENFVSLEAHLKRFVEIVCSFTSSPSDSAKFRFLAEFRMEVRDKLRHLTKPLLETVTLSKMSKAVSLFGSSEETIYIPEWLKFFQTFPKSDLKSILEALPSLQQSFVDLFSKKLSNEMLLSNAKEVREEVQKILWEEGGDLIRIIFLFKDLESLRRYPKYYHSDAHLETPELTDFFDSTPFDDIINAFFESNRIAESEKKAKEEAPKEKIVIIVEATPPPPARRRKKNKNKDVIKVKSPSDGMPKKEKVLEPIPALRGMKDRKFLELVRERGIVAGDITRHRQMVDQQTGQFLSPTTTHGTTSTGLRMSQIREYNEYLELKNATIPRDE